MHPKLLWLTALLCLCSSLTAHAASLEQIREKGALRVAVYKDFPPYSYNEQSQLKGIDVELGKALATQLGLNVDYMLIVADENMDDDLRNTVWKGHYIGGGTADVMLRVPYDLEYAERNDRVSFLAPYAHESIVIIYDNTKIPSLNNLQILQHHKIGVETDSVGSFYLSSIMQGSLTSSLQHYLNFSEAMAAFKAGQLHALVGMRGQLEGGLAPLQENWLEQPLSMRGLRSEWDVGLAVKEDNDELAALLTQAITTLREQGEVAKIFSQYGMTYIAPKAN